MSLMKTVLYRIINHSGSLIATIHNRRPSIYPSLAAAAAAIPPPPTFQIRLTPSPFPAHHPSLPLADPTRIIHPPPYRSLFHPDGMMYRCRVVRYAGPQRVMNTKFNLLPWRLKIEQPRSAWEPEALCPLRIVGEIVEERKIVCDPFITTGRDRCRLNALHASSRKLKIHAAYLRAARALEEPSKSQSQS